jgi:predicted phosphoadenosine phosphosulfate sulfurtransferase
MDLLFFLKAHNALHQVTGVILCKIYSNALLVLFNNRLVMANASGTTVHTSQSLAFRAASHSQHETWNSRPTVLLDSMELQTSRSRDAREQAA